VTTPQAATALGIATVYQDLALCDNLDVVANLYLGREELGGVRLLDETGMVAQQHVPTSLSDRRSTCSLKCWVP